MTSSSDRKDERKDSRPAAQGGPFLNVAAPVGSKAQTAYGRFIPREELGSFTAWQPGALAGMERRNEERRREERGTADRRCAATPTGAAAATATTAAAGPSAAQWQERVTAARQSGYHDGYRDGLVALDGFKLSLAQQNAAQIGSLLTAFDEQLQALDGDMAHALARTALLLAQQVLRSELLQRPELVADVARQAVNTVMHSARQVTVHVHPQDLPLVSQGAEELLATRGARLRADSTILRGGVLVSSDVGTVDARLDTRWAEAAAALGVQPLAVTAPRASDSAGPAAAAAAVAEAKPAT